MLSEEPEDKGADHEMKTVRLTPFTLCLILRRMRYIKWSTLGIIAWEANIDTQAQSNEGPPTRPFEGHVLAYMTSNHLYYCVLQCCENL